jgi:hypothetical protein
MMHQEAGEVFTSLSLVVNEQKSRASHVLVNRSLSAKTVLTVATSSAGYCKHFYPARVPFECSRGRHNTPTSLHFTRHRHSPMRLRSKLQRLTIAMHARHLPMHHHSAARHSLHVRHALSRSYSSCLVHLFLQYLFLFILRLVFYSRIFFLFLFIAFSILPFLLAHALGPATNVQTEETRSESHKEILHSRSPNRLSSLLGFRLTLR